MAKETKRSPWAWIPTLYYAQGIPYVVVMTVSVIMYKRLGISNTDIALYTSWLYLPWVIKPLWSPIVDLFKTKRWWIVAMQLIVGAGLAGVAFTTPLPGFFQYTLAFFWLLAFSSATHDIAADGFYMLGLKEHEQAYFVGIRSTFYRFAMITGQGLLIILAGFFEVFTGQEPVQFNIEASPSAALITEFAQPVSEVETDELTFFVSAETLKLSTENITKETADSLRKWVADQNLENGFVLPEQAAEAKKPSRFSRNVSDPLANYLRARFRRDSGPDLNLEAMQGNIGLIGITLSAPPEAGKEIILNSRFRRGDASIRMIQGDRLAFNENNWSQTAWIAIQVDRKLDRPAEAFFEGRSGNIPLAWSITFFVLAGLFLLFFVYHRFILPRPATDKAIVQGDGQNAFTEFFQTFGSFFRKPNIGAALAFLLLFRLGEAQLVKLASPFLLDAREIGGLGLTTGDVGLIYGTIGILALTLGGILGGMMASQKGLKFWILPMTFAINLPNLMYVYLSYATPTEFWLIAGSVAIEQFGYGFGFTAYMLFMIYFAEGKHKTAHFAICTGFMALGMMIPGMFSGWLQEIIGYQNFFIWVMICTLPGFLVLHFLKIEKGFGIKKKEEGQE
ncbi:MAG: MFS transporter [Bacteroidales bacterium]|nr:MFS transporter [Bacteroidales bacterium]